MKRQLKPDWTQQQRNAGEQFNEAWEAFFATAEGKDGGLGESPLGGQEDAEIASIRARYEGELLGYPNVVGVAEGMRMKKGKPTKERCLVVYVQRKIPRAKLGKDEVLPNELEGVRIDVVEVGKLEPLPA